jgi:glycosyltransferase involved in cell wall biosynthesis
MLKMDNKEKLVCVEPAWKYPLSVQDLVLHPPEGYRFITPEGRSERLFRSLAKHDVSYRLQAFMGNFIPIQLLKSHFNKLKSPPKGSVLTYSLTHLVLRKEPWILDMGNELPYLLVWSEKHLEKYKDKIKEVLNSNYCRKIICRVNKGKEALLATFGEELEEKIEVVYWGAIPKNFKKHYEKDEVKILFVNSANINTTQFNASHFCAKGGLEVLEAFIKLSSQYKNLKLTMRSSVPKNLKYKFANIPNLRLIDQPIHWLELEKEWKTADIFVLPNHGNTPAQVFYDAMSYELPIITTDTWANSEIIEDGETGFLIHDPVSSRYTINNVIYLNNTSFKKEVLAGPVSSIVRELVKKTSLLIEDPNLRRIMGKKARRKNEFLFKIRNQRLKDVLDACI